MPTNQISYSYIQTARVNLPLHSFIQLIPKMNADMNGSLNITTSLFFTAPYLYMNRNSHETNCPKT